MSIPGTILDVVKPLGPPLKPWRGWRNTDKQGSGTWLASRDDGARHHLGRDALSLPGDDALAMLDGTVRRLIVAYAGGSLRGAEIRGVGQYEGIYTVQLYFEPAISRDQRVYRGQIIGKCQDVASYYAALGKDGMSNHLHVECWANVDPADLIPRLAVDAT